MKLSFPSMSIVMPISDFSDLGKMVYEQSHGFKGKEDVIRKVMECDETPEAIRKLKDDLKCNYQKFFKEHFSDNDFQQKWENLQWYRNKVAHNNLFVEQDSVTAKEIATSLLKISKPSGGRTGKSRSKRLNHQLGDVRLRVLWMS